MGKSNGYKSTRIDSVIAKTFFVINRNSTSKIFAKAFKCCVLIYGYRTCFEFFCSNDILKETLDSLFFFYVITPDSMSTITIRNMRKNLTLKATRTNHVQ